MILGPAWVLVLAGFGACLPPAERTSELTVIPYTPVGGPCAKGPLVREANGISSDEAAFVAGKRPSTAKALQAFFKKSKISIPDLDDSQYPIIALTSSGGGLRATLGGGGVHKAYDGRENAKTSVSGILQAITYESGLSGGSWLLSSIYMTGYATISKIQSTLWEPNFGNGILQPNDGIAYSPITAAIGNKADQGYPVSAIEVWGREIAYDFYRGGPQSDNGMQSTWSGITSTPYFTNFESPLPIIVAAGADAANGQCRPASDSPLYEFSPLEFGSWHPGVNAFTSTKYLGSKLSKGVAVKRPAGGGPLCATGFDRTSLIIGASSNVWLKDICPETSFSENTTGMLRSFIYGLPQDQRNTPMIGYTKIPNPFRGLEYSPKASSMDEIYLADGGTTGQANPIEPFLYRKKVDFLIVNDNGSDGDDNFPTGETLRNTYDRSQEVGLEDRMPEIPEKDVLVSKGLNKRPTVFGCRNTNPNTLTILYLANREISYPSGKDTGKIQYWADETRGMIDNSVLIATNNGAADWGKCMSCFIMRKALLAADKPLPDVCGNCFDKYCYN